MGNCFIGSVMVEEFKSQTCQLYPVHIVYTGYAGCIGAPRAAHKMLHMCLAGWLHPGQHMRGLVMAGDCRVWKRDCCLDCYGSKSLRGTLEHKDPNRQCSVSEEVWVITSQQ